MSTRVRRGPKPSSGRRRALKRKRADALTVQGRVERLIERLRDGKATVDRPGWPEDVSETLGTATPTAAPRDIMGSEYIAALAEGREEWPAWYGGEPHRDEPERLGRRIKSLVLPDWFALPLVRRVMRDDQLRKQFENSARPDKLGSPESDT